MEDLQTAVRALNARILEDEGRATKGERQAAFANNGLPEPIAALIRKVAANAHTVNDGDFAQARSAGWSEDHIFELVVCAAVGQAGRLYDTALTALRAAGDECEPKE